MKTDPNEFAIRPVTVADLGVVALLAAKIWHAHYPGIIAIAQIDYMLAERYAPQVLRAELERADIWWDLLVHAAKPCAFSSLHLGERAREAKLDKLYVDPTYQRRGCGAMLIEHNARRARALGCTRMILAVNKRNTNAIAAYRKHGFEIEQALVTEIGGGFVMDDYIMALAL